MRIRRRAPQTDQPEGLDPAGPEPIRGSHPEVLVRVGTSDPDVYLQIFGLIELGPLPDSVSPGLIVDCGANVGYSAVYLLERYPAAEVIAIEPDPGNAAMARRNLATYGGRATVIEGAVWSRAAPLRVRRGAFGDGREWSFQVEEAPPGARPELIGIDLDALLAARTVELLKIDIERAECELFRGPCRWLRLVRNIAIELHDDECSEVFHRALANYRYEEFSAGELTFCCDLRARE